MSNPVLLDALARLDRMDEVLATLRLLAQAYHEEGDAGAHVAEYLALTVGDAAKDLAVLARKREAASA